MQMPRRFSLLLVLSLAGAGPLSSQAPSARDVIGAYARLGAQSPWPGFKPDTIPLAIYDGDTTWLAGHPSPPAEFLPGPALSLFFVPGQHESVKANTAVPLGGVFTATLLLDRTRPVSAARWAATAIHEAFHVYQHAHHADWTGNEGELFTYPVAAETPQRLQRLETEAWRRAVTRGPAVCWARTALQYRQLRFGLLPVGAVTYERGSELNEGLATYVELRAAGLDSISFPASGYSPDEVRLRAYTVGPAIGRLLDQASPAWRETLERGPTRPLDDLLQAAVGPGERCRFTAHEEDSVRTLARADVQAVRSRRQALRDSVLSATGWRIEIVADSAFPLFPERFDPWNVVPVGDGMVVHRRFLRLAKDGLTAEVLDRTALTEPAGSHPLFNGIRRLLISGLPEAPIVEDRPGSLLVTAPGVRIEGRVAGVDRTANLIRIRAGP
ncbi:MAG TPA: hypothetical protein VEI47_09685 [Gemmatimonadales bacterium]|nr:hypothetical protein [Gemmatimonadales bacterium]